MGRRQATIRDANAANACADGFAQRRMLFQSVAGFATLVFLLCASMLRAQGTTPVLGTVTGDSIALAINSNNLAGQAYNFVLNTDSSVSMVANGAIVSGQGCPAFSGISGSVSAGAVYVDSANDRIYLAMVSGNNLYAAYENLGLGSCTQGPLLQLTTNALSNVEMNVDTTQGNVYILNSYGAFPDQFYILPIASWSASSGTALNMDYSVLYGPIVIDPSNDVVYINDLGDNTSGSVGTYATSGFIVYDPSYSATPANNLQHVVGYNSGGASPTAFNVGTLLSNGTGELALVNNNPVASTTNLGTPITILNVTAPQALFFTNTTKPYSYNNDVDITPGANLSTISAASLYYAIGGADINAASNVAYVFAYKSTALTTPGLLLEYNLATGASSAETVLNGSMPMPSLYDGFGPWSVLNYNPESTELALSASLYGSGALGVTSPVCAGAPLSLTQVVGSEGSPTPISYPVVNASSGYVYTIQYGQIDYVAPPTGCTSSPPIQISPTTLPFAGFPDESYTQNFTATGGSGTGYTWSITSGGAALNTLGLTFSSGGELSGYPNAAGTYKFTVQVVDSLRNSAVQSYTLTIYPGFSVTPTALPPGNVGTLYSETLFASGGSGYPYSFSVASGTALSAVGLTLAADGVISGTPTTTETAAPFTLRVADSQGDFSQLNYTLTINSASSAPININDPETITVNDSETQVELVDVSDPETVTVSDIPTITITSTPLNITTAATAPIGYVGVPYAPIALFTASGGVTPYSWSATGLPTGLSIANSTGVISGTPTAVGDYLVTVRVTDAAGNSESAPYPIVVESALAITTAGPLPTLYVGSTSNLPITFSASGGSGGYSWTIAGQPSGLTMSTGGVLSGAPTELGVFNITVTVKDSFGDANSVVYSLTVISPSLQVTASPTALTIRQGQSGSSTLTFTPIGGYSTTLTLSCSGLPANSQCTFTTPSGAAIPSPLQVSGAAVSVVLTIKTDVTAQLVRTESAPTPLRPGAILTALAFLWPGSLLGLIALRRKGKLFTKNPRWFGIGAIALLIGTLAGVAGCVSGGGFGTYVTPVGTSTVTVTVTPNSGSAQTLNIGVTVTQ